MIEKRLWDTQHPLRQFATVVEDSVIGKLESAGLTADRLLEMTAAVRPSVLQIVTVICVIKC
jgi:hypothetical protein